MRVLIASNTGAEARGLAMAFPGRVGYLMSPGGWRRPDPAFPYAIDDGAFAAWTARRPFDSLGSRTLLGRVREQCVKPDWVAAQDVVMDRGATLAIWDQWAAGRRGCWHVARVRGAGRDESRGRPSGRCSDFRRRIDAVEVAHTADVVRARARRACGSGEHRSATPTLCTTGRRVVRWYGVLPRQHTCDSQRRSSSRR